MTPGTRVRLSLEGLRFWRYSRPGTIPMSARVGTCGTAYGPDPTYIRVTWDGFKASVLIPIRFLIPTEPASATQEVQHGQVTPP